jgi:hypothetical protein
MLAAQRDAGTPGLAINKGESPMSMTEDDLRTIIEGREVRPIASDAALARVEQQSLTRLALKFAGGDCE